MTANRWRMGFHLMPPTGWVNDPNGLCYFNGLYHVFHQYSPDWPNGSERGWGHATSPDLVHWTHHGMVIHQDIPEDANGAYSGSAYIVPGGGADGGDLLRLYYTGNVKEPGAHDYIYSGRQANEILIETTDGFDLGEKQVLLRNADYPDFCSCHVRDPKVWSQDGSLHMLLGARDMDDEGLALIMESQDGLSWTTASTIRPTSHFGFMWECPDRIALDGFEYLSFCPQGMAELPWANGLRDQSGYIPLPAAIKLIGCERVSPALFRRWDFGFDFYAPQTFTDPQGRTILIGWMGLPEPPFDSAPDNLDWIHCLTVPRVLTRCEDGVVAMAPAPELEQLRGEKVPFAQADNAPAQTRTATLSAHRADIVVDGISGPFDLALDGAARIAFADGELTLSFDGGAQGIGRGRQTRSVNVKAIENLRVLVDDSALEIFANNGREVFSTRWFPKADQLGIAIKGTAEAAHVWPMGDGMEGTY